jgi:16S rRNA (adenine1518-N6/adenine1519-N6)-dimethyltransferase
MRAPNELPPLRDVIATHGLNAKKSLGQHFLFDLNLTRRIARASGPLDEGTILEVGPGPGGLTRALLLEGARRVLAIERDARCMPALEEIAAAYPGRLEIVQADALEVDETALIASRDLPGGVRICANLPYNVATALLVKWLTCEAWPPFWSSLTLMFQREVAERIVAKRGSEAYGRLSILAQWRTHAKILFDVSRTAFVPQPKVTSAIVRLEPRTDPIVARISDLEAVTAASFGQRRKMLRQSLRSLVPDAEGFVRSAGIDPTARPEQLSVADFAKLANLLRGT